MTRWQDSKSICSGCIELAKTCVELRTDLAMVTAERDALRVLNKNNDMVHTRTFQAERNAHAETRKMLDICSAVHNHNVKLKADLESVRAGLKETESRYNRLSKLAARDAECAERDSSAWDAALESTRAELASWRRTAEKLEARVKELESYSQRLLGLMRANGLTEFTREAC